MRFWPLTSAHMDKGYEFIANTTDGVFAVDTGHRIVLWNEAATATLGYRADEVLGKHCYEVIAGTDSESCVVCHPGCDAMELARNLGLPPNEDLAVRTKKGETVWLNISCIVVPSPAQELSVLIHLFRDRSQRHEVMCAVDDFTAAVLQSAEGKRRGGLRKPCKGDTCVRLTRREQEVLRQLAAGATTERTAARLGISPRTVTNHVSNILGKLGVHSRLEAVAHSRRNGLI